MDKEINVLYVGGYWSTNIGNAFYDLGIKELISSLDLKINFHIVSDLQKYMWSNYNSKKATSFNLCQHYANIDYLILSGPMMYAEYMEDWKDTLLQVMKQGTKVIFLSVGGNMYTEEEVCGVREILKDLHLYAMFTRDRETYECYKDLFEYSYNGICCAFFIPEYFRSWKLTIKPYVVYDFESYNEPVFVEAKEGFSFAGGTWKQKNELQPINKFWSKFKEYPDSAFHDLTIIRPKNTCHMPRQKKYYGKNIYLSNVATDYLNIYANAEAVFSDRVHACVGALAQGTPAMFFGNTRRANLFGRVNVGGGVNDIYHEPVRIDVPDMDRERQNLKNRLKEILI